MINVTLTVEMGLRITVSVTLIMQAVNEWRSGARVAGGVERIGGQRAVPARHLGAVPTPGEGRPGDAGPDGQGAYDLAERPAAAALAAAG